MTAATRFFDVDNVRAVTGGRWLRRPDGATVTTGVGLDTRKDLSGRIFVAIAGDRFDGHEFLGAAREAGAALAIVERQPAASAAGELPLLLVPDTRRALSRLALGYRRALPATKVIAVTGSCGKTTTKGLIDALLATAFSGTAAPRSFNNDIGVPLTMLAARPLDKYLVVEIGANAPGEIAKLGRIVEPDIAVITSIGRSHLEGFGSLEAVAREKAALLAHLRPGGLAVVNADAPGLDRFTRGLDTVIRYGESDTADLRLTARGRHEGGAGPGWWLEINGRFRFDLALPGRHNAINALAAIGIGRRFGLDDERMSETLRRVEAAPMRMACERIPWRRARGDAAPGFLTLFNDAYNANPDSMAAAFESFIEAAADAPRRIVVLGDMLELGDAGPGLHREVGRALIDADAQRGIDHAFVIGSLSVHLGETLTRVWPASRITMLPALDDEAVTAIRRRLRAGDAVLVKASRSLGFERLVDELRGDASSPTIEITKASASRRRDVDRQPTPRP